MRYATIFDAETGENLGRPTAGLAMVLGGLSEPGETTLARNDCGEWRCVNENQREYWAQRGSPIRRVRMEYVEGG
ncbi:MAG: hypothetical protein ACHREM_04750 [Polyangiales bacterium]